MDPCLKIRRRRGTTTLLAGLLLTAVPAWAQAQANPADQSVERARRPRFGGERPGEK